MKTLITAIVLATVATSASAFTCKNTVEMTNGEWSYTTSQCGNQAPASAEVLEMVTYTANNPPKDLVEEEVIAPVVVAPVVEEVVELTKVQKLEKRLADLKVREAKKLEKGSILWGRVDQRVANKGWKSVKNTKLLERAQANAKVRKAVQASIKKVEKRIARLNK
jgi:hypothetical protein